jgi:hypothetical protein
MESKNTALHSKSSSNSSRQAIRRFAHPQNLRILDPAKARPLDYGTIWNLKSPSMACVSTHRLQILVISGAEVESQQFSPARLDYSRKAWIDVSTISL